MTINFAPRVKVWDRTVRVLHWVLVLSVAIAWLTTLRFGDLHQPAGYVALAAVLLRTAWGCVGGRYARFRQFVRSPRATLAYLRRVSQRREARYIGHNPLGGWMILALMGCVSSLGLTGWLYTTDRFWGDALIGDLHHALAWALLGMIALHVAGVILASIRHRENLVRAMVDGSKPAAQPLDID